MGMLYSAVIDLVKEQAMCHASKTLVTPIGSFMCLIYKDAILKEKVSVKGVRQGRQGRCHKRGHSIKARKYSSFLWIYFSSLFY